MSGSLYRLPPEGRCLKGSLVDISDGHTPARPLGPPDDRRRAGRRRSRHVARRRAAQRVRKRASGTPRGAPIHPRLLAMMQAARYFGLELDPQEFRLGPGETVPTAAALSDWAKNAGMWSRALRLRWRHLFIVSGTGPVVLLFNDGTAGLLTGANPEAKIVGLIRTRARRKPIRRSWWMSCGWPRSGTARPSCCAPSAAGSKPIRRSRSAGCSAMMMKEKKVAPRPLIASLAFSFLTIVPPLIVMQISRQGDHASQLSRRCSSSSMILGMMVAL